jgi:hypothetical protein
MHVEEKKTCLICSSCTGNTESQGRAIAYMRVVALGKQRDNVWALGWFITQQEPDVGYSPTADIVGNIAYGNVEQFADGTVVRCSTVCKANRKHASISDNRILFPTI